MTPFDLVLTNRGVRFMGRYFPCSVGKGGIRSDKREGDGATPRGLHSITGLLYRADRMSQPAPWAQPIGKDDLWSDASGDAQYNQQVHAPYAHSHEKLRRADPLYDLVLLTDWNWPRAEVGKGSAIFLHTWRRRGFPTEGCIAFRRDHMHFIARNAVPGTRVIVP
ncbi:L,D-peptidoglycan transpeptidase YkuD (ErfK/YbiS/YcfS/YnhG family) [Shimia isoporae]|uniref:L,D-peptidoglycan transpeptidase YkuD (ErfK/YbiS/YcfS/YnhG family) n=1 Tax=Shimia isoporae TaxID=647720 RepID=A0A4R1N344_9RHOB|nr:L,D-transpeptidase family protein [Shimia isoporae]TCL00668.1 L,D-peptidoglycan transpeptidase YkuD (ErfK/YbiS/YcfS/YnhG family) [Shimia isoporae]